MVSLCSLCAIRGKIPHYLIDFVFQNDPFDLRHIDTEFTNMPVGQSVRDDGCIASESIAGANALFDGFTYKAPGVELQ